jgi:hypothetical protein
VINHPVMGWKMAGLPVAPVRLSRRWTSSLRGGSL